jgi:phage I-like protein
MGEHDELFARSAFVSEVPVASGARAARVQLMPMGEHRPRHGTPPRLVLVDRAHAEAVVAASNQYRGPNAMVIDYDHQPVCAPAVAGWISKLIVADDGIWADVNWTALATAALADRRYRYISPYFGHRPNGRVTRIINAGLINTPNLDLAAVASTQPVSTSTSDWRVMATALRRAEDADASAFLAAIHLTEMLCHEPIKPA